jgi:hypothetical protein
MTYAYDSNSSGAQQQLMLAAAAAPFRSHLQGCGDPVARADALWALMHVQRSTHAVTCIKHSTQS